MNRHMRLATTILGLCLGLFLAWPATSINADERLFGYSYQADSVLPKGVVEFEQWATLRSGKGSGKYSRWDIRNEIEYGFTDTFTGAIYLNFTSKYANGVAGKTDGKNLDFDGVALELKQMLQSPHTNPIGILVYLEPKYSGSEFELEEKLVLEHIMNKKWHFVLNVVAEQAWEFEADDTSQESKLKLTGGVSHELDANLAVGGEFVIQKNFSGFYKSSDSTMVFVGPNIHYGNSHFQITAALLTQLTNDLNNGEAMQARVITGFYF